MGKEKLSGSDSDSNQHSDVEGEVEEPCVDERLPLGEKLLSIGSSCLWVFWCSCTFLLIAYLTFGVVILYSKTAKMEVIFSNRIRSPWFANLSDCKSFGIIKCENIQIRGTDGMLGAWLISPSSKQYIIREAYILYLHGNMGSRALEHRVKMYKKLSKMGYHILAIDYRGFGDSDGFPTEQGLVEDGKVAYRWLLDRYHSYPLYIWGHSLGSAVGVQVAAWLNSELSRLNGLILEAPFNNLTDAIKQTPLAAPVAPFIPNFESYLDDVKNVFRSSYWIQKVNTPTIIIHDRSDHIINIALGRRLLLSSKELGLSNVNMVELDENLYHQNIYAAKKLKAIVGNFIYNTS